MSNELTSKHKYGEGGRPTFSIIMPTYNVADCVVEAISSIKTQTYPDFECIIVDDGSTDGSVGYIKDVIDGDDRFRLLTQKNKGPSSARNKGYELSVGRYVLFLDGDDRFSGDLLYSVNQKVIELEPDILVYNHSILDNITGYVGGGIHELSSFNEHKTISPSSIADRVFNVFGNQAWSKVFSRDFIDANNLRFDEKLKRVEDLLYTHSAVIMADSIAIINKPLVEYRINRGISSSDTLGPHYRDTFYALEKLLDVIRHRQEAHLYMNSYARLFLENTSFGLYSLIGTKYFKKSIDAARRCMEDNKIKYVNRSDDSLAHLSELQSLLTAGDNEGILNYMLVKEKADLFDSQVTIRNLEIHIEQLKNQNTHLEAKYNDLKTRYSRITSAPHIVRAAALKLGGLGRGPKKGGTDGE